MNQVMFWYWSREVSAMREISNVRAFGRHTEPRHVKDLANEVDTMGGASYSDVKHIIRASTQLTFLEALPELQLLFFPRSSPNCTGCQHCTKVLGVRLCGTK